MIMASCLIAASNSSQSKSNGTQKAGHHLSSKFNCPHKASPPNFGQVIDIPRKLSSESVSSFPEVDFKIIRLKKYDDTPLGFSIRGGWEHGTGTFVSEVHSGSEAEKKGLKAGDQILTINGFLIDQAIHEEVIALIKSSFYVTLKVKSIGMIPIKGNKTDSLSWKFVGFSRNCPIHSWSPLINTFSNHSSSVTSSRSDISCDQKDPIQFYEITNNDFIESKVFIQISKDQGLGCSVVKGPLNYPGIFVHNVKEGGIAQESGLEVGDQIIAMNGTSFEPSDIGFNEAISRIKSCQQMTLTVRKKSGLNLFFQQKQKVKSIIHTYSNSESNYEVAYHSPSCLKHSESCSPNNSSANQNFHTQSEHDYSISEIENTRSELLKYSSNEKASKGPDSAKKGIKVIENDSIIAAQKIYDKVKREEERIAEEKKKLENEQKRLRDEFEKLEKEKKQLEHLKSQDDCKSISSVSSFSGAQSIASSGSGSQIGFLDEIKKLAEKRSSENGLITDTLNKTKNLEKISNKLKSSGQDDESRKRHELLMEEFKAAHSKMFGQTSFFKSSVSEPCKQTESKNGNLFLNASKDKNIKQLTKTKTGIKLRDTCEGETVTILKTLSSSKKPPAPPIPVKQKSAINNNKPVVTINSYGSGNKNNNFLMNDEKSIKSSESYVQPNETSSLASFNEINQNFGSAASSNNASKLLNGSNGLTPISIKINFK